MGRKKKKIAAPDVVDFKEVFNTEETAAQEVDVETQAEVACVEKKNKNALERLPSRYAKFGGV